MDLKQENFYIWTLKSWCYYQYRKDEILITMLMKILKLLIALMKQERVTYYFYWDVYRFNVNNNSPI